MAQLPLELGHRASYGGEDFLIAPCNQAAVAWFDRWPDWPGPGLAVHGPPGCGKTHLAHVFQAGAGARLLRPADLEPGFRPALIEGARACVLDDAPPVAERALLHLHNALAERGGHLLILSRLPPARWGVALPDLASRLAALPAVRIEAPDDSLVEALLVKLFADRQIAVEQTLISYVATRIERSFAAARAVVGRLDVEAMRRKRALTRALAAEILR